jgi:hypothetical protein
MLDAERRRDTGVTKLTPRDENDLSGYKKKALYSCVLVIFFFAVVITINWPIQTGFVQLKLPLPGATFTTATVVNWSPTVLRSMSSGFGKATR